MGLNLVWTYQDKRELNWGECVGPKAGESLKFMALTRKNWWHVQVHGAHKKELRVSKARWTKTGCLNCLSCLAYMVQKSKVGLPWRKYAMQSLSSSDCQLLRSWMDPCSWPKGPFRSVSTSCLRWTTKREREREGEKRERESEKPCLFMVKPGFGEPQVWDEVMTLPIVWWQVSILIPLPFCHSPESRGDCNSKRLHPTASLGLVPQQ